MAGDHCLTDEGANRPALLANLQDPAACLAIHHSHSNCCKLTIKDLVPHLNPSALPTFSSWLVFPSMPMCGHAHTSQEDESLNRQQDWYLLFTPYVIMILLLCTRRRTQSWGRERQGSQAWSTLLCHGAYSSGQ